MYVTYAIYSVDRRYSTSAYHTDENSQCMKSILYCMYIIRNALTHYVTLP